MHHEERLEEHQEDEDVEDAQQEDVFEPMVPHYLEPRDL